MKVSDVRLSVRIMNVLHLNVRLSVEIMKVSPHLGVRQSDRIMKVSHLDVILSVRIKVKLLYSYAIFSITGRIIKSSNAMRYYQVLAGEKKLLPFRCDTTNYW